MKHVKFPAETRYVGADIVEELIASLCENYKDDDGKSFTVIDIINDPHPRSDLWLCRDGLFHFSFADIFRTLDRFVSSGTPACLLTTHTHIFDNTDIRTGFFRRLNLLEAPFRLPKPTTTLRDSPLREMERSVGWWRNEEIAEALRRARQSGAA
jgi:hypothetical protein